MDHIAILNKQWKLIPKILNKEKTIETRWYLTRRDPWNKVMQGDTIYFKDSGEKVTAKAQVEKVLQYDHYSEKQLKEIIEKYGGKGQIYFEDSIEEEFEYVKDKNYAILMFLKNPESIKPFDINKQGFGNACAWLCVENIEKIKI
jgi:S-adenosylmethionine:tRNA-ribosyltransferase-isomerase (queuine synthetase)